MCVRHYKYLKNKKIKIKIYAIKHLCFSTCCVDINIYIYIYKYLLFIYLSTYNALHLRQLLNSYKPIFKLRKQKLEVHVSSRDKTVEVSKFKTT